MGLKEGGLRGSLRNVSTGVTTIPASAIARWTLDNADTEGSTAIDVWGRDDDSITQHDGTITGATTGVSGANQTYDTGEAYSFTTDDHVTVTDESSLEPLNVSLACWVFIDSQSDFARIIQKGNGAVGYGLTITSGAEGVTAHYDDGTERVQDFDATVFSLSTWHHLVMTWDGTDLLCYTDGVDTTVSGTSGGFGQSSSDLAFGRIPGDAAQYLDGDLDDIRLYDKALTATEVSNLYNTGRISG